MFKPFVLKAFKPTWKYACTPPHTHTHTQHFRASSFHLWACSHTAFPSIRIKLWRSSSFHLWACSRWVCLARQDLSRCRKNMRLSACPTSPSTPKKISHLRGSLRFSTIEDHIPITLDVCNFLICYLCKWPWPKTHSGKTSKNYHLHRVPRFFPITHISHVGLQ